MKSSSNVKASPALREYEESMQLRHAESLAAAIVADPDLSRSRSTTVCRTLARFVVDAYALAREAPGPEAAVDEIFRMVEAAWEVTAPVGRQG